jgi:hypothetical protein
MTSAAAAGAGAADGPPPAWPTARRPRGRRPAARVADAARPAARLVDAARPAARDESGELLDPAVVDRRNAASHAAPTTTRSVTSAPCAAPALVARTASATAFMSGSGTRGCANAASHAAPVATRSVNLVPCAALVSAARTASAKVFASGSGV